MSSPQPTHLGRYRLVRVLGSGAMGVVYEAQDERLGRTVAIKTVLRSHLDDEATAHEYAARFEREARAAARLSHPHIVGVYDFGEHEDLSYIVMEFVRGRELAELFKSGERFTLAQALQIMGELLDALDYAHANGVVHRDIKPANVLIDQAGHVKLADFGVARITSGNQDRTMPGTLVGTPNYMSPEQILGQAVGSRGDIFAAGVVLYQFLTGRQPFAGGGAFAVQRRILQEEPVPPSQLAADLPAALDAIVARALAKQPQQRHDSAAALAAELRQVAAGLQAPPAAATAGTAPPAAAQTPPAGPPAGPPGAPAGDDTRTSAEPGRTAAPEARTAPLHPGTPPDPTAGAWAAGPAAPAVAPDRRAMLLGGAALVLLSAMAAAWWLAGRLPAAVQASEGRARAPAVAPQGPPTGLAAVPAAQAVSPAPPPADSPSSSAAAAGPAAPDRPAEPLPAAMAAPTPAPPPAAPSAAALPKPEPQSARSARPPPARGPAAADNGAPRAAPGSASRCTDLLDRLQLGEPLSAEQNAYFQARCTR